MNRDTILRSPAYWFEYEQNELFRQVNAYMERENINRTELAERLNVSKGYISQVLNGNFNYTLKKLIEICLAIGIVPKIDYKNIEEVEAQDTMIQSFYENSVQSSKDNIILFFDYTLTKNPFDFEHLLPKNAGILMTEDQHGAKRLPGTIHEQFSKLA